jgi:hypothetical protein
MSFDEETMADEQWVTGGDGVCRMRWAHDATCIAVGAVAPIVEECGGPATQAVMYKGDPHLVCEGCETTLLEKPGGETL